MTVAKRKILLVEDDPDFVLLMQALCDQFDEDVILRHAGTLKAATKAINNLTPDLVLLDLMLPDSRGLDTLQTVCSRFPGIPVIVMTSISDKELGEKAISGGAQDYIVKGRCDSNTLFQAVKYSIERKRILIQKDELVLSLREALAKVKQLTGLLPICASCKKIRDKEGKWVQMEAYISAHSEADFTHGLCKDCMKKYFRSAKKGDQG